MTTTAKMMTLEAVKHTVRKDGWYWVEFCWHNETNVYHLRCHIVDDYGIDFDTPFNLAEGDYDEYRETWVMWTDCPDSDDLYFKRFLDQEDEEPDTMETFLNSVSLGNDNTPIDLTEAVYNMCQWTAEGIELPEDMTPEKYMQYWNQTICGGEQ